MILIKYLQNVCWVCDKVDKKTQIKIDQFIRISVKIAGKTTSVSVKKNIIALWVVKKCTGESKWREAFNNFIYECLDLWDGETGRGFSEFLVDRVFLDCLSEEEYLLYNKIRGEI